MSKKQNNVCRISNYIDHLLIVIPIYTGCVPISASAIELKICVITSGTKKYEEKEEGET